MEQERLASMKTKIGKTHISIEAQGCYRCGTLWSSGWHPLKDIPAQVGDRLFKLTLHVCADCATPAEKRSTQIDLTGRLCGGIEEW